MELLSSARAWALTTKNQAADGDAAAIAKLCAIGMSLHFAYKMFVFETTRRKKFRLLGKIPGDKPDFFSTELVANINRLKAWRVESTIERYPSQEVVTTSDAFGEVVVLSPRMVETILKTEFQVCGKPRPRENIPFMSLANFVGGEGIFVLTHGSAYPDQDAKWSAQRKSASKIFTKNNFNTFMYETITEKSDAVLDVVGKLAKVNSEKQTSNVLDIQSTFFSFTFCAIQRIFFNRDTSDSIYGKHDEMQHAFDEAHRAVMRQFLLDAPALLLTKQLLPFPLGSLSPHANLSFNPGFWLWRQFTGHYGTMVKHVRVLKKHTSQILKEVKSLDEDLDGRQDLLAHFFRAKEKFTDKQLSDVILNFILAGRDTTACTLTWFMFELTQNQDVQDKLAEEVRSVIGRDGVPTLDDVTVESMPYMHCCFLETLRMYPPVPEDNKMNTVPITLPDGTSVPAHTNIVYSPYVMGRDPSRYPEPNVFRPDRWEGKNPIGRVNGPEMFEFPVFQAGPRYCLGLKLAQNETKLLMSRLLQSYKFDLDPAQDPTEICPALMITMSLCNETFPDVTKNEHELNVVPTLRP